MECDIVHATIEGRLRIRELYLPSDLIKATKEARKNPFPYEVKDLTYVFFKNYSEPGLVHYASIRPGIRVNDAVVTDLRVLRYNPSGTIEYAIHYDSELQQLPRRPRTVVGGELKQLHKERLTITKKKYDHLQQMKPVIPNSCWKFYDNIPFKLE